ncbi:hypothetical protein PAHA111176_01125 [Parendozoicomonas haliclonae]|uniref:MAPK phosphothreonine lyase n=2 Tax=Parendozoicomonas haliclonae TaxID=1960125 RepID=A0A1X7AG68_9GAMM|nr:MAPK phosphothreonine lyase [Parendozoicomonas haliclonae]
MYLDGLSTGAQGLAAKLMVPRKAEASRKHGPWSIDDQPMNMSLFPRAEDNKPASKPLSEYNASRADHLLRGMTSKGKEGLDLSAYGADYDAVLENIEPLYSLSDNFIIGDESFDEDDVVSVRSLTDFFAEQDEIYARQQEERAAARQRETPPATRETTEKSLTPKDLFKKSESQPDACSYKALFEQVGIAPKELTKDYRVRSGWNDSFIHFTRDSTITLRGEIQRHVPEWEGSKNLRLNVHKDDLEKAWNAVSSLILSSENPFHEFKVTDIEKVYRMHKERDMEMDFEGKRVTEGGQFTLYTPPADHPDLLKAKAGFVMQLQARLKDAGVRPGVMPDSDVAFDDQAFISFRDKDFSREGLTNNTRARVKATPMHQLMKKEIAWLHRDWDLY